jgi:hypothetical protein
MTYSVDDVREEIHGRIPTGLVARPTTHSVTINTFGIMHRLNPEIGDGHQSHKGNRRLIEPRKLEVKSHNVLLVIRAHHD